jgi:lysophospholipase L1-like esterase
MTVKLKESGTYKELKAVYQKYSGSYYVATGTWYKSASQYLPLGIIYENFDYIAISGSSTSAFTYVGEASLGSQVHKARQEYCADGIDLPILTNTAISGSNCATLNAAFDAALVDMAAQEIIAKGKRIGFVLNIGSNDVGQTPFADMPQATKDGMAADITSIVNKIKAVGGVPIVGTVNPRKPVFSIYREWNDLFFIPLARQLTPDYVPLVNGVPTPMYDLMGLYEREASLYPDWYNPDNVHPGESGVQGIRRYTAKQFRLSASVPKLVRKRSVIIGTIFQGNPNNNFGGLNFVQNSVQSISNLVDREGNVLNGSTFVSTHTNVGTSARGNRGDWTVGWEHPSVQSAYAFTSNSVSHTCTLNLGSSFANKTGTLLITYNVKNNRESKFTSNGNVVYLNGFMNGAATGVIHVSVPFTTDSNGSHTLLVEKGTVENFAAWSGLEYVFDWLYV